MGIEMDRRKIFMLPKAYPREALGDLLPLPNPISMQVDPASLCNFKCSFCPTGDPKLIKQSGRAQVFMKFELFEKIVADIATFERPLKVLKLFKDGEPMLNPRFVDMVALAKREPKIERVTAERYLSFARVRFDYDAFVENVRHLFSIRGDMKLHVKTVAQNLDYALGEDRKFF